MDSWSYGSVDKGYILSNETVNSLARSKNVLMDWGLRDPFNDNGCNFLVSSQQPFEDQGFIDKMGYPQLVKKQPPHDSVRNVLSSNNISSGDVINPASMVVTLPGDEGSCSKLSSSVVESSSRESSLIDLKLGRLGDNLNSNSSSGAAPNLSCPKSSAPVKRPRPSGSHISQYAYCQVYGCNKDLSNSKDYHKRHKVCEVHSKTPKVIVNGIEQRFCQQCSRFHLLAEFDDGKRSCRKRLAGHNERRRKPQGLHSVRTGRLLHPYNGSVGNRFQGPSLTSFICQDILPTDPFYSVKYGTNDWRRNIKVEDGVDFSPKVDNACISGQVPQKNFPFSYGLSKQCSSLTDSINNTMTGSVLNGNTNQFSCNTASHSLYPNSALGNEDFAQGLTSSVSESGCALSLLSSQPHNSSGRTSDTPSSQPLFVGGSSSHYRVSDVSRKPFGISSERLTTGDSNNYSSYRISSTDPFQILDNGPTINPEFANIIHGSDFVNVKDRLSCDAGATIDLFQLSSQLQRVEHQRQHAPVKRENDAFWSLRIT